MTTLRVSLTEETKHNELDPEFIEDLKQELAMLPHSIQECLEEIEYSPGDFFIYIEPISDHYIPRMVGKNNLLLLLPTGSALRYGRLTPTDGSYFWTLIDFSYKGLSPSNIKESLQSGRLFKLSVDDLREHSIEIAVSKDISINLPQVGRWDFTNVDIVIAVLS